eukprot:TRINITY_DN3156_c0_g2_i1.p2 TRINITY_DN3156_c0_g2~~TRINITY_DN3156_c0_g2_i1.p2  ORF type:complete len:111 (+),score=12.87 TRINITY_DN3156_c0_g2_i1:751-1083(+)
MTMSPKVKASLFVLPASPSARASVTSFNFQYLISEVELRESALPLLIIRVITCKEPWRKVAKLVQSKAHLSRNSKRKAGNETLFLIAAKSLARNLDAKKSRVVRAGQLMP